MHGTASAGGTATGAAPPSPSGHAGIQPTEVVPSVQPAGVSHAGEHCIIAPPCLPPRVSAPLPSPQQQLLVGGGAQDGLQALIHSYRKLWEKMRGSLYP